MTGDQPDFAIRLARVLPRHWFADDDPVLGSILAGLGAQWADVWGQVQFVRAQTRIATSSGAWLDQVAAERLPGFLRRLNEPDAAWAARISAELVRPRNTRSAVVQVLRDLTGHTPVVINPASPDDCGAWDTGTFAYDVAGCWGDLNLPFQSFVTVKRGTATPIVVTSSNPPSGWDTGVFAYDTAGGWADSTPGQGVVTDSDIYAAVAGVQTAGHVLWTQITGTPVGGVADLDNFILDVNQLDPAT